MYAVPEDLYAVPEDLYAVPEGMYVLPRRLAFLQVFRKQYNTETPIPPL